MTSHTHCKLNINDRFIIGNNIYYIKTITLSESGVSDLDKINLTLLGKTHDNYSIKIYRRYFNDSISKGRTKCITI